MCRCMKISRLKGANCHLALGTADKADIVLFLFVLFFVEVIYSD